MRARPSRHLKGVPIMRMQPALLGLITALTATILLGISAAKPTFLPSASAPMQDAIAPDAAAIIRTAMERIGGEQWKKIKSFESIATVKSAMGDARIEFRFVAPDARQLVQSMPGGRGIIEMGSVGAIAWMGEPGRARAIDPKLAHEMSGGGDLQTMVHSLDTRFENFISLGKIAVNGRDAWKIAMTPKGSPASQAWSVLIDALNTTVLGIDIPAPPKDLAANAPEPSGQSIRFTDWQSVEVPAGAKAGRMLGFRSATIEAGGMKTELAYTKVAVDTLEPGAIAPPAKIEPAPTAR